MFFLWHWVFPEKENPQPPLLRISIKYSRGGELNLRKKRRFPGWSMQKNGKFPDRGIVVKSTGNPGGVNLKKHGGVQRANQFHLWRWLIQSRSKQCDLTQFLFLLSLDWYCCIFSRTSTSSVHCAYLKIGMCTQQLDYFIVRIKSRVRAGELYLSRGNGNLSHGNWNGDTYSFYRWTRLKDSGDTHVGFFFLL